ncbi:hypothetical protein GCM10007868_14450 [Gluconobacter frateurii]|uniref:Transposase n=1 Tax=Gluconobacter frateurii NRIC 0228 TaxID=1307946 RepID=A0ABQ0QEH3_9PROT|nr:hypothetical protein AA0228_2574 [Gluconobacter frateurii NRIC 0228]GLP90370.1 hypothetical protein GCM10007868_14450 [Gluconobacter frateurii]
MVNAHERVDDSRAAAAVIPGREQTDMCGQSIPIRDNPIYHVLSLFDQITRVSYRPAHHGVWQRG